MAHTLNTDVSEFTSVCGDRLAMVNGRNIIIWDFVTHGWATWNVSEVDFETSRKVLLTHQTIALVGQNKIAEWDIPMLTGDDRRDNMNYNQLPTTPLERLPRVAVDLMAKHQGALCLATGGLCHWYNGSSKPMWIDFIDKRIKPVKYDRFRFHSGEYSPDWFKISESSTLPGASIGNLHGRSNYRLCGQNVVIVWPELTKLLCQSGSPEPGCPGKVFVLDKIKNNAVDKEAISLCPISGTLCYIDKFEKELVVLQYFRAPNSRRNQPGFGEKIVAEFRRKRAEEWAKAMRKLSAQRIPFLTI